MPVYLDQLSEVQRSAATMAAERVYIEAGAGTGKTRTLAARMAVMVEEWRVDPGQILALCFTRNACSELLDRLRGMIGELADLCRVDTFHAHLLGQLRSMQVMPAGFTMASGDEELRTLRGLFDGPLALPLARRTCMRDVRRAASLFAAQGLDHPFAVALRQDDPACAAMVERWAERLRAMRRFPGWAVAPTFERCSRDTIFRRFMHVLVDEAHDATPLEWSIAQTLASGTLTVVADPRQCVFGWRGGRSPEELALFASGAEIDGGLVRLQQTYRFGPALAESANLVGAPWGSDLLPAAVETVVERTPCAEPGGETLQAIVEHLRTLYAGSEIAVLARTNDAAMLASRFLPDAVLAGGDADPLLSAAVLVAKLGINHGDNLSFAALAHQAGITDTVLAELSAAAGLRRPLFEEYRRAVKERPEWLLARSPDRRWLLDVVPSQELAPNVTLEGWIRRAQSVLEGRTLPASSPTVVPFALTPGELGLRGREAVDRVMEALFEDSRGVWAHKSTGEPIIMTVHGAKGLEWDAVVVLCDSDWPGEGWPVGEERRLLYVAQTRARRHVVFATKTAPWSTR